MDDKTAELRDIFMDVTDGQTITENQEVPRGSLTENEERIDERVRDVIERMREQFDFRSGLDDDRLRQVVAGYYDGESDGEIADRLGVSTATAREYCRVVETRDEIRSVNGRFTDEFAELLTDADLQGHTEDVADDGLDEATDGMETDVSF